MEKAKKFLPIGAVGFAGVAVTQLVLKDRALWMQVVAGVLGCALTVGVAAHFGVVKV